MAAVAGGSDYVPVVVDTGSMYTKAGIGGEEAPREIVPTVVGRPRHPGVTAGVMFGAASDALSGADAISNRGLLTLSNLVTRGRITDWADIDAFWHHVLYSSLQVSPEEHPMLFTETPDNTREDREKMVSTLFETLNVPALAINNTAALSLFATGRATGLVIESGAGRTHVGPVWDGYVMKHYLKRIEYGGEDVTQRLVDMLRDEGYPVSTPQDRDGVRALKEQLCYVAADAAVEKQFCSESRIVERLFRLPDGQDVYVNETRFLAPEILMRPRKFASPDDVAAKAVTKGWHEIVRDTIGFCDAATRPQYYSSIVLAGGNTMFPKLEERLQRDVSYLAPKGVVTKCVAFRNRQQATWIGGSILASLSTFESMWVTKAEYDEHGPTIIHRKTL